MDELRDKYLQGKLTEAEKSDFEKQLSAKEKEELAFELGVRDELELQNRIELRKQVEGFEGVKSKGSNSMLYLKVAASIVLVTSLVFILTRNDASAFEQYYEVYPNYEVTALRGETTTDHRLLAYAAYDEGSYTKAIDEFNQLASLQPSDRFFRGISYIQVEDYGAALNDLITVMEEGNSSYENPAMWYVALIHLKLGDEKDAIPLLMELSIGESEYATISKQILKQL